MPSEQSHPEVPKFLEELRAQVAHVNQTTIVSTPVELTPLQDLANEVRTWLQVIKYKVDDPKQIDDHTMSMIATLEEGIVSQKVLVHCIGGEISAGDVQRLSKSVRIDIPQGILISDKRISRKTAIFDLTRDVSSSQPNKVLDHSLNCRGMNITATVGLDATVGWTGEPRKKQPWEITWSNAVLFGTVRESKEGQV